MRMRLAGALIGTVIGLAACSSAGSHPTTSTRPSATSASPATSAPTGAAPTPTARTSSRQAAPGHVLIVIMENRSYSDVVGNASAPYLNQLAGRGLSLTAMHAITHPSQPNYLALFAGASQGVIDDSCPHTFAAPNLGSELRAAQLTFAGYAESLPTSGSPVCSAGAYARKHVPWTDFRDLPAAVSQPLSALPTEYTHLPTVSFVIPNLEHDMHDGTIAAADTWLQHHLAGYARWATLHQSVLVVTWDEDDRSEQNRIPTFVIGAGITPRRLATPFTLYSLLRTIEDRYGLPALGASATAPPIPFT